MRVHSRRHTPKMHTKQQCTGRGWYDQENGRRERHFRSSKYSKQKVERTSHPLRLQKPSLKAALQYIHTVLYETAIAAEHNCSTMAENTQTGSHTAPRCRRPRVLFRGNRQKARIQYLCGTRLHKLSLSLSHSLGRTVRETRGPGLLRTLLLYLP